MPAPTLDDLATIEEVDETKLRPFYEPTMTRQAIFGRTLESFEKKFPLENDFVRIEAKNWNYDQKKLHYGISQTKDALMKGGRLSTPLYADVTLLDKKTGKVLDQRKGHLMANVPYLTDRGTFVMKGTEYVTVNQTRLRPGIYTRLKDSGELEAHINVKPGTGSGMRMFMEPDTGIFRLKVGEAHLKLYPILSRLGVKDEEMAAAWGTKVLEVNRQAADKQSVQKLYNHLVGDRGSRLLERIRSQHDPDNTQKTAADYSKDLDPDKIAFYGALTKAMAPGNDQDDPEFAATMLESGFKSVKSGDGWKYEQVKTAMLVMDFRDDDQKVAEANPFLGTLGGAAIGTAGAAIVTAIQRQRVLEEADRRARRDLFKSKRDSMGDLPYDPDDPASYPSREELEQAKAQAKGEAEKEVKWKRNLMIGAGLGATTGLVNSLRRGVVEGTMRDATKNRVDMNMDGEPRELLVPGSVSTIPKPLFDAARQSEFGFDFNDMIVVDPQVPGSGMTEIPLKVPFGPTYQIEAEHLGSWSPAQFRGGYGDRLDAEVEKARRYSKGKGFDYDYSRLYKPVPIYKIRKDPTGGALKQIGDAYVEFPNQNTKGDGQIFAQGFGGGAGKWLHGTSTTHANNMVPHDAPPLSTMISGKNLMPDPNEVLDHELSHSAYRDLKQLSNKQPLVDGDLHDTLPAEVDGFLSRLQHSIFSSTGKRLETKEETEAFFKDLINIGSDKDFETRLNDFPSDVRRLLRATRRAEREGKGDSLLHYIIERAPAFVGNFNPQEGIAGLKDESMSKTAALIDDEPIFWGEDPFVGFIYPEMVKLAALEDYYRTDSGGRTIVGHPLIKMIPSFFPETPGEKSVEFRTHGIGKAQTHLPGVQGESQNLDSMSSFNNQILPLFGIFGERQSIEGPTRYKFTNLPARGLLDSIRNMTHPEGAFVEEGNELYKKIREAGKGADTVISYACNAGADKEITGSGFSTKIVPLTPDDYGRMFPSAKRVIMTPPGHLGHIFSGITNKANPVANLGLRVMGKPTVVSPRIYERAGRQWIDKGDYKTPIDSFIDGHGRAILAGTGIVAGSVGFFLWEMNRRKKERELEEAGMQKHADVVVSGLPTDFEIRKDVLIEQRKATNTAPTEAQREKGNYRMGHVRVQGLDISIENPKGSTRSGTSKSGHKWSVKMKNDYGYIRGTQSGADGDHIDVFLGPDLDSEVVYVVDQRVAGKFDEHKCMVGWKTSKDAKDAYMANFDENWKGFMAITPLTMPEFKWWIKNGDSASPMKGQHTAKFAADTTKWIGVDLDSTLAEGYGEKGFDPKVIGKPVPSVAKLVKGWIENGETVKIMTARAHDPENVYFIKEWLEENGFGDLEVTNEKDPGMILLLDDRAFRVAKDKGLLPDEIEEVKDMVKSAADLMVPAPDSIDGLTQAVLREMTHKMASFGASDLLLAPESRDQAPKADPYEGFDIAELTRKVAADLEGEPLDMPGKLGDNDKLELIRHQLNRMEVDPEISFRNLGIRDKNMGPVPLLATSKKLLSINRGEAEPDDRDSKANQTFHSVEDFMAERVEKDAGGIGRALLYRSRYNGSLQALRPGMFTKQLEGLVVSNSLSQAVPGINPVELMDIQQKVTQTGEGGIGSRDSIPMEARNVHTSQLGVLDPIRTTESGMVGVDQRFSSYARKGPGNQLYMPLKDRKTGKTVWRTPSQVYGKTILFPSKITYAI